MATKHELLERLARAEAEISRLKAQDAPRIVDPHGVRKRVLAIIEKNPEQEHFIAFLLNARQKILAERVIAVGALSQVDVHPRELFRDAIRMVAHSIIMAHNHPSGDTEPSAADYELTRRMIQAGKLLGIPVLDHVIVTDSATVSLASLGFSEFS